MRFAPPKNSYWLVVDKSDIADLRRSHSIWPDRVDRIRDPLSDAKSGAVQITALATMDMTSSLAQQTHILTRLRLARWLVQFEARDWNCGRRPMASVACRAGSRTAYGR
jgi:hypothetical protein